MKHAHYECPCNLGGLPLRRLDLGFGVISIDPGFVTRCDCFKTFSVVYSDDYNLHTLLPSIAMNDGRKRECCKLLCIRENVEGQSVASDIALRPLVPLP